MWQKCPICNGIGSLQNFESSSNFIQCRTCNGSGIISEISGLPPARTTSSTITVISPISLKNLENLSDDKFKRP